MTSALGVNSAIPVLAFTTTGSESNIILSVDTSIIPTLDSSDYYSHVPRSSESSSTTIHNMASFRANGEFQIIQDLAEYMFVDRFAPNEQFGNPDITIDEQTGNL